MDTGDLRRPRKRRFRRFPWRGIGADAPRGDSGGLGTGHLDLISDTDGWRVKTELLDIHGN